MREWPLVSIIIPTCNRVTVLTEALGTLAKLDYPKKKLEIIVIDDGSTDETQKEVRKLIEDFSFKLKYFYQLKKGISEAKNLGITNSKGEIIVTTDDDCLFEKNWLKKLIPPLFDPKVGSVGGPDRAYGRSSRLAKAVDFAFSSFISSGGIHGRFTKRRLGKFYPMGCNMAVRREILKRIGLFEPLLAPGEETDLNHRIELAGYRLAYSHEAFVWHRARSDFKSFITHAFKRGFARVEMIRRYSQYTEVIYLLPSLMILGFVFLFLTGFIFQPAHFLLAFLVILYLFLLFTAGLSALLTYKDFYFLPTVSFLITIQHIIYGFGFLYAVIKLTINRIVRFSKGLGPVYYPPRLGK